MKGVRKAERKMLGVPKEESHLLWGSAHNAGEGHTETRAGRVGEEEKSNSSRGGKDQTEEVA